MIVVGGILVAVLAAFVAVIFIDSGQRAERTPPDEVEEIDVGPAGQHSEGNVSYDQNPPAGGEHNPVWQNCGFYPEPVRNETAVHSLEHGAVWITYREGLPQAQVDQLQGIATSNNYVLVSPYPDLPSPVVASAWGNQVQLEGADDPALEDFISAFQQGPQTPEPGAACSGGVGSPS